MGIGRRGVCHRAREESRIGPAVQGESGAEVSEGGLNLQRYDGVEFLPVTHVHMAKGVQHG